MGHVAGWKQAPAVLERCVLAIAPRAGFPLQPDSLEALETLGGRVITLNLEVPATASSAVRQNPDPSQIPTALVPLLLEHNLYGLTRSSLTRRLDRHLKSP